MTDSETEYSTRGTDIPDEEGVAEYVGYVRRRYALLALVFGVAVALRVFQLGAESLWLDEATTVVYVERWTLTETLVQLPNVSPHPPLYFVLIELWASAFGTSEVAIRSLSAVLSVLTIPTIYLTGRELYGRRTGLLSAGLVALSSFQLYFAQDARMYSLLGLLTLLSNFTFLKARHSGDTRWFAGYSVSTALLLYTHVLSVTVVIVQALFVGYLVLRSRPVRIRRWLISAITVGVLYSPWGVVVVQKLTQSVGTDQSLIAWNEPPSLFRVIATPVTYFGDPRIFLATPTLAVITAIVVGVGGLAYLSTVDVRGIVSEGALDDSDVFVVVWLTVPILALLALAYSVAPVYAVRYTIPASFALYLLVARGVVSPDRKSIRYGLSALVILGAIVTLPAYYGADQKEQWQETANHIERNADADDLVVVTDEYVNRPFSYYYSGDVAVEPVRETVPPDRLRSRFGDHDTVWLLVSHATTSNERRIVDSFDDRYVVTTKREWNGITMYRFNRSR